MWTSPPPSGLTEFLQHIILRVTGVPASAMGIDMGAGESGEARAMGMIRGERRINDLRDQITNLIPDIFKAMGAPETDDLMFTWGRAYMQQKAEQAMQQMAQQADPNDNEGRRRWRELAVERQAFSRLKRQATLSVDVSALTAADFAAGDEVVKLRPGVHLRLWLPRCRTTRASTMLLTFELAGEDSRWHLQHHRLPRHGRRRPPEWEDTHCGEARPGQPLQHPRHVYGGPAGDAVTVFAIVRFTGAESGVDQDGNSVVTITANSHGDDGILET